jgi:hypothetical protein
LTNKLVVIGEKFKKYFKITIARVKWYEIPSSKYECEKTNSRWICSVITREIKITYFYKNGPKNF